MNSPAPSLIFDVRTGPGGNIGIARLNQAKTLNALNLEMVQGLARQLSVWERDADIHAVFLDSTSERAFCAGGDVKTVAQRLLNDPQDRYPAEFFRWEYKMDYMVRTCRKPIVCWGDGIVMGGGLGLFNACSHRVVTERSVLAMPEITIGFFPDVGASYFLNRLPGGVGLFLAWTAARIGAADALHLRLADFYLPPAEKQNVLASLQSLPWQPGASDQALNANHALLTGALARFARPPESQALTAHFSDEISRIFTAESAHEAREKFLASGIEDPWWRTCREAFVAGSPLSAHVIFEQLRRARGAVTTGSVRSGRGNVRDDALMEIFVSEWNLACQMSARSEFPEGVRALLIDKDGSPRWNPATFEQVSGEEIEAHFAPCPGGKQTREFFSAADFSPSWFAGRPL